MPKTGENARERRARLRSKQRQNRAVYESQAEKGPEAEVKANQKLEQQDRIMGNEGGLPDLFPANNEPDPLDETAVSEQEQGQYTQLVKHAATMLYNAPEAVVAAMSDQKTQIHESAGRIVAQLGMAIEQKANASGDKVGADVMFHAGDEIVGMVLDLAIQGGILKVDPESEDYQKIHGLTLMEAEKAFGERMLADPKKGPVAVDEAGNLWAQQIGREVDAGTADPAFMEQAQGMMAQRSGNPVRDGVSQALRGG